MALIAAHRWWEEITCWQCDKTLGYEVTCGDVNVTEFLCVQCADKEKEKQNGD